MRLIDGSELKLSLAQKYKCHDVVIDVSATVLKRTLHYSGMDESYMYNLSQGL